MVRLLRGSIPVIALALMACSSEAGSGGGNPSTAASGESWGAFGGRCVPSAGLGIQSLQEGCSATYSGRATVVDATVNALVAQVKATVSDAGPLPSAGGLDEETLASVSAAGVVTAKAASARTAALAGESSSEASVLDLQIGVAGVAIAADAVTSTSRAVCGAHAGASIIANLRVNGLKVVVTGEPNQIIDVGLVRIAINEHITVGNALRVNAIHVTAAVADIVVSAASAGITCSCAPVDPPQDPPEDPPDPPDGPRDPDYTPPPSGPSNPGSSTPPQDQGLPAAPSGGGLGEKCSDANKCASGYHCAGSDPTVH